MVLPTGVCGCANVPSCSGRAASQLQPKGPQRTCRPPARGHHTAQPRKKLSGSGPLCRSTPEDFNPEDQTMYQPLRHRPYSYHFYPDEELPETDDWMTVSSLDYRNGMVLGQTVNADLLDSLFDETLQEGIELDDMNYWFTKPPGGWASGHRRVKKAQQIPTSEASAQHFGEDRTDTLDLIVGQEITGTITKLMLHHGALVDIGAQHDALLPVRNLQWDPDALKTLEIFSEVRIRIHKIVHSPICRFPLIAELAQPELRVLLPDVGPYEPCFDLRGGWDFNQMRTMTGRDMRISQLIESPSEEETHMERPMWLKNETDAQTDARYSSETAENLILRDRAADLAASM